MTKEAKPDAGSPTVEMTEEEIVRDVWLYVCKKLF